MFGSKRHILADIGLYCVCVCLLQLSLNLTRGTDWVFAVRMYLKHWCSSPHPSISIVLVLFVSESSTAAQDYKWISDIRHPPPPPLICYYFSVWICVGLKTMLHVISPPADSHDLSVARQSGSSTPDATQDAKYEQTSRVVISFSFHTWLLNVCF